MPRFFTGDRPDRGFVTITGEDAHHIARVLRMKPGENLTVCTGEGTDLDCELAEIQGDAVVCRVLDEHPSAGEPTTDVTLYMALPKADKMELIVQKAVELGVKTIVPYVAARRVSRPDAKGLRKKEGRWQKIAESAAKQSGRGVIPVIGETLDFTAAIKAAAQAETALFFYEGERETGLRQAIGGRQLKTVSMLIGPEGGFAPEEVENAVSAGLQSVSLGARILRCETAPLAALAAVMYESGNF